MIKWNICFLFKIKKTNIDGNFFKCVLLWRYVVESISLHYGKLIQTYVETSRSVLGYVAVARITRATRNLYIASDYYSSFTTVNMAKFVTAEKQINGDDGLGY